MVGGEIGAGQAERGQALRRALALHQSGATAEARAIYEGILRRDPDDFDALNLIGLLALESGACEEALSRFERAVAVRPDIVSGHRNVALAYQRLKQPETALRWVDQALLLKPEDAESLAIRGSALKRLDRPQDAVDSYRRALACDPGHADAHNDLGCLFHELRRFEQALDSFDQAISVKPDHAGAHANRGQVLTALGRPDEAVAGLDRALAIRPGYAGARVNRAVALLSLGRFEEGWRDFEARKLRKRPVGVRSFETPLWLGQESVAGRTVLIFSEQGLGDTIQFCRYLPLLAARGARVLFAPQKPLIRLLADLDPSIQFVDADEPNLPHDFHAPLMSLPLAFGTVVDAIPAPIPYLHAEPSRVADWKARLGPGGFKIGIAWQGRRNPALAGRSFPVEAFASIAAKSGVRLISLQKGDGIEQLETLPTGMKVETPGFDFDAGDDAFVDTAAVMECCDLVLTLDTAVAHLAGALGRPTWVVLEHAPDWRWMQARGDSPWYPTMRLFRQAARDDWRSAFQAVEAALRRLPAGPGPEATPRAPVGWGEIIDKITILEIKRDRLQNAGALVNVRNELEALEAIAVDAFDSRPGLAARKCELATVNNALWDIEDALRDKEALQDFGDEFIALARAVYHRNDERARIKRAINDLLNSGIIEEKSYQPRGLGGSPDAAAPAPKG